MVPGWALHRRHGRPAAPDRGCRQRPANLDHAAKQQRTAELGHAQRQLIDKPARGSRISQRSYTAVPRPDPPRVDSDLVRRPPRGFLGPAGYAFAALGVRDYRFLVVSNVFSQVGLWIAMVAEGWLAFQLTGSATFLGAASALAGRSLTSS